MQSKTYDRLVLVESNLDGLWYILASLFTETTGLRGIPLTSMPNVGELLLDILEKNKKAIQEILVEQETVE